jgi:membrane protease subunit (stomatin/prohibitin family)
MIGNNMGQFMQYQTAQAIPKMAEGVANGGGSGVMGDAMGLGAGVAMGQVLAQQMQAGLAGVNPGVQATAAAAAPATPKAEDVIALIEKLGDLKAKGILSDEEFATKKAELLSKL